MNVENIALSEYFDGNPVATFVINRDHVITHWNRACEQCLGLPAANVVGSKQQWVPFYAKAQPVLADLIVDQSIDEFKDTYYPGNLRQHPLIPGAYQVEEFFPTLGLSGTWLLFTAAPLRNADGEIVAAIQTLEDVTERREAENELRKAHSHLESLVEKRTSELARLNGQLTEDIERRRQADEELRRRNKELTDLNSKLTMAQEQLVQSEKMASIGQLAAGVAHEINNPIGYIFSNVTTLQDYLDDIFHYIEEYRNAEALIQDPATKRRLQDINQTIDINYLKEDIPVLMNESREGIARVRQIVQDLKDFSRVDASQAWGWANIHAGIDSTLNIVNNEVKYKADIIKEYGDIPEVECLISQINQVIMNMVVNAAHAIEDKRGQITIRTGQEGENVWIDVSDNGSGIRKENLAKIFDPFFTTKPIGKGTGLGLSLSYGIIKKHCGHIEVQSEVGKGTTFHISIPIRQNADVSQEPAL